VRTPTLTAPKLSTDDIIAIRSALKSENLSKTLSFSSKCKMFRDEAPAVGAKNELTLLGSRLDKRYRKVRKEMRRNVGKFQFKVNFIISVRFSVCWQWVK
jgi:hypothetical protein